MQNGSDITCTRFRVMLSISDQDPENEKFGELIFKPLEDLLDSNPFLSYPFYHLYDISHNPINSQASLDRGRH